MGQVFSIRKLRRSLLPTAATTSFQVGMVLINQILIRLEHRNLKEGIVSLD
jgi:hypothetical protein